MSLGITYWEKISIKSLHQPEGELDSQAEALQILSTHLMLKLMCADLGHWFQFSYETIILLQRNE